MGYDELLQKTHQFGKYQIRMFFLLNLPKIFVAYHTIGHVFLAYKSIHRCALPDEVPNSHEQLNISESECKIDLDHDNSCSTFIFDTSVVYSSMATQFLLVCDRRDLQPAIPTSFSTGCMLGAILFGYLADKYGRRYVFCSSIVGLFVFGMAIIAAPEIVTLLICRIIIGLFLAGVEFTSSVLTLEMSSSKYRPKFGLLSKFFYGGGYILLGLQAYYIRKWKYLQLAITAPMIVLFSYFWLIPESVRWCISKQKLSKATDLFMKFIHANKASLDELEVRTELEEEMELIMASSSESTDDVRSVATIRKLYKYRRLTRSIVFISISCMANCMTYYGLSWGIGELSNDVYFNFFISALLELPAYILAYFAVDKLGRKFLNAGGLISGGIALQIRLILYFSFKSDTHNKKYRFYSTIICHVGKFFIMCSFLVINLISIEIIPTAIRTSVLGITITVGNIGSMIAPYINSLGTMHHWLPPIIYGSICLPAGILSLWIPESKNKKMPNTLEEGEEYGKRVYR